MIIVVLLFCILHILSCQMTSAAPLFVMQDDYEITVQKFLAVAEAVKAVELAGGPRKILQDPLARDLPPYILRLLHGLTFVLHDRHNSDIEPRVNPFKIFTHPINTVMNPIKGVLNHSVNILLQGFNMIMGFSRKPPTPDPDFEGW